MWRQVQIPLVPHEFMPKRDLVIHYGSSEARRAYARLLKIQRQAWDFAKQFLRKSKPNPSSEDAKKCPLVVDAPKIMSDIYSRLRNQEIQAWNALAKLCGLPLLPSLRRRGRRRILVDFGPELQAVLPLPMGGPIGDSRRAARESVWDAGVYVPPQDGFKPFQKWPSAPRPRREVIYDREPFPAKNSGPR